MTIKSRKLLSMMLTLMLVAGLFAPVYSYADDEAADAAASTETEAVTETEETEQEAEPVTEAVAETKEETGTTTEAEQESVEEPAAENTSEAKVETSSENDTSTETPGETTEEPEDPEPEVCEEHVWGEWVTTKEATYFEKGSRTRTCTVCGETETETIAKLTATNKWVKKGSKKFYFNSKGKLAKGWYKIKTSNKSTASVRWCFFGTKKGTFVKSVSKDTKNRWVTASGKKFYFTSKKKPADKGFNFIGSNLYYMGKYKAVVIGKFKADGKTYKTDSKGRLSRLTYLKKKYNRFILVDISDQTLRLYRNESRVLYAHVVTGKPSTPTPTGTYSIKSKARNVSLTGSTWNVKVSYWMPFIGSSYGFHDASWRSSGQFNKYTYKTNGSHGCVNMKTGDAKKLYNNIYVGTVVIIQN